MEWMGSVQRGHSKQRKEEKAPEARKEMAAQCLQLAVLVAAGSLPKLSSPFQHPGDEVGQGI